MSPSALSAPSASSVDSFSIPASVTLLDEACCIVLRQMIAHLTNSPNDDEARRHLAANVKLVKDMSSPIAVSLRAARFATPPRPRSSPQADDDAWSDADADPDQPTGKMGEISQEALDRLHRKYPHVPREHKALLRAAAMDIYGPDFMTDIDVNKAYGRPPAPPPAPDPRHRPVDSP